MRKNSLRCLTAMLLLGSMLGVASCNKTPAESTPATSDAPTSTVTTAPSTSETPTPTPSTSVTPSTSEQTSVIKSLTAKSELVDMRIGDSYLISNYYVLTGKGSLSAKQKSCTYESDNPAIVAIASKSMKAVGIGEANITVTSKEDTSFKCTFKVNVKNIYFNHTTSTIYPDDDFEKELIEDGGTVETKAMASGDYFVNAIDSKMWVTETTVTVKEVSGDEQYPKFGIVASTNGNANEGGENRVYFFLDGYIGNSGNYSWTNFGVCEVFNSANWAWNPGVGNETARHNDAMYTLPSGHISPEAHPTEGGTSSFTIKVAHENYDFHVWVNGNYAGSMKVLEYLFSDAEGNPVNSTCGFFQFKSDVVYSNYSASQDEATVRAAIDSIETKNFLSTWAED